MASANRTNAVSIDRRGPLAFALGVAAVTAGVLLHIPMFIAGRAMGNRLTGMPVDTAMIAGMALILGGVAVSAYGLLPRNLGSQMESSRQIAVSPPEDAPLGRAHWLLMIALVMALVIDIMKPASLGLTIPGMIAEYGVARESVSLVPFFALTGTVVGSIIWGFIADIYGRKASILLSAVMFVGTSVCGVMPSLAWNVAMCFLMGAAAGGLLPVAYALLAEMMPTRHRGWSLVLVGGLGASGGYFAATGLSALLQPLFGWRILWLLNLPTGLLLLLLSVFIPESARFLLSRGKTRDAENVMRRFGARAHVARSVDPAPSRQVAAPSLRSAQLAGLSLAAICFGLVSFGLLLWLPQILVSRGFGIATMSELLSESALIALPTIFVAAFAYRQLSTKWSVVGSILVTIAGLGELIRIELGGDGSPLIPVTLLIVGSNALIAMLLPYTAESFPLRIRGRTTGIVAACSKAGGLIAQAFAILALMPSLALASIAIAIPSLAALLLVAFFGRETRGIDLRDLDPEGNTFAATGL